MISISPMIPNGSIDIVSAADPAAIRLFFPVIKTDLKIFSHRVGGNQVHLVGQGGGQYDDQSDNNFVSGSE